MKKYSLSMNPLIILLFSLLIFAILWSTTSTLSYGQDRQRSSKRSSDARGGSNIDLSRTPVSQQIGLKKYDKDRAFNGYTLFAPKHYTTTYVMDMQGRIINIWNSQYEPGQSVYLLENGNLLHCCMAPRGLSFTNGGEGGYYEEYDWDGNLIWSMSYVDKTKMAHHDIEPLPNGNILLMVLEKKSFEEAVQAGFDPVRLEKSTYIRLGLVPPEYIIEVERKGANGYNIVWEWHIWDHLIQDIDSTKSNYGNPKEHPERLDINATNFKSTALWNHGNSIDYNPEFDQIVLDCSNHGEFYVIDATTTTEEAKGHTGGKYGKGGDILYRWGNPQMYGAGTPGDQAFYSQHDANWIPKGYPGEGNIMVFNNGGRSGDHSSVVEVNPPVNENGFYTMPKTGDAFAPAKPAWTYIADPPSSLHSKKISSARRLPNGNTLICDGTHGRFIEVTEDKETVWEYVNPVAGEGAIKSGQQVPLDQKGHQMNAVFHVQRFAPDYPAFKDKDMTPILDTLIAQ